MLAATPINTLCRPAKPVGTAAAWLAVVVDVSDAVGFVVVAVVDVVYVSVVVVVFVTGTDPEYDVFAVSLSEGLGCGESVVNGKVNEPLALRRRLNYC